MAALKDQWKEQRRQRQLELERRQRDVREVLDGFQQERQAMSAQLRSELSAFQQAVQEETQSFLADAYQKRLANAKVVADALQAYKANLHEQVAQFLSVTSAERSLMSQELFQALEAFHASLSASVADLRLALQQRMQEIQLEVQVLQADTQDMLVGFKEQRIQEQQRLLAELAAYVDGLRDDVHAYLSELELARVDRANQLWAMLQQSRDNRAVEMEALMTEFAEFRNYLQSYRQSLHNLVWGNGEASVEPQPPAVAPQRKVAAAPVRGFRPVRPVATAQPKVELPKAPRSIPPTPAAATPASELPNVVAPPKPEPPKVEPPKVEEFAPAPVILAEASSSIDSLEALSEAIPLPAVKTESVEETQPALRDPAQLEMDIFKYIQAINGARLTEIETALSINRFQAVDALRSLIKKGNVTQRDRIYLIPEEVNL
ncbi:MULTISPECIES: hypothetical protein [unclassified Leptolyngbya]|uniref:hypothetical protein n=1 Tax=unclassified Leptolyngbya TaxID=2650499 RepID=UPI001686F60F|nr:MULTISPECIES: hypothetical protein [unclassified Leptolyngbya]MBD1912763.1 hypothetical protein [Leptolyngbya sp. FACHB-8]MBD2157710.1 hypothetical protein [Leptolyngbya sp. FACHB-16]